MKKRLITTLFILLLAPSLASAARPSIIDLQVRVIQLENKVDTLQTQVSDLIARLVNSDFDSDGFTPATGDCNDAEVSTYPGAAEIPDDGIDNNCDGQVDEGIDLDADGFSVAGGDCDDTNSNVYPGAPELSDGIDNNCDGQVDEGIDLDADGFSVAGGDCDDTNSNVYPGAPELSDGIDNNCDGQVDEGIDLDADSFSVADGDCDDTDSGVYPGASEIPGDGVDQNCDSVDDCYADSDQDGFGNDFGVTVTDSDLFCSTVDSMSNNQDDCNDSDAAINPLATEIPSDGIDNNCDGVVD